MAILETNQMMFTAFEPKLQNRFLMDIDGIPAYLIKQIARPSVEFSEVVLDHINVKRKIKGKANWTPISCQFPIKFRMENKNNFGKCCRSFNPFLCFLLVALF